jgi:hypothetical protein
MLTRPIAALRGDVGRVAKRPPAPSPCPCLKSCTGAVSFETIGTGAPLPDAIGGALGPDLTSLESAGYGAIKQNVAPTCRSYFVSTVSKSDMHDLLIQAVLNCFDGGAKIRIVGDEQRNVIGAVDRARKQFGHDARVDTLFHSLNDRRADGVGCAPLFSLEHVNLEARHLGDNVVQKGLQFCVFPAGVWIDGRIYGCASEM